MGAVRNSNILSNLAVRTAMRRRVVTLPPLASLKQCINHLIKFKVNALLVSDEQLAITGLISKTDIIGAYYAGLPFETPVMDIMTRLPLFCSEDESLEQALNIMQENTASRLYVQDGAGQIKGVIAAPDIVGMLYRYCRRCPQSRWRPGRYAGDPELSRGIKVKEIMTPSATSFSVDDILSVIMEGLSTESIDTVLIRDREDTPVGVVSKTDLILAYRHGLPTESPASQIMSAPVLSVNQEEYMDTALKQLILCQLQRIFVFKERPDNIIGALNLSESVRKRSGSCQACIICRMRLEDYDI
ncbi:MAG: CBS domain-containing protein [Desulfocapsaceae bacterium]|nr:CBS domain-containing protein [Desulfocapsaceae bacterium]